MLNCNVDGTIFVDSGLVGWAAVVRNDAGGFVMCISGFMKILVVHESLFWLRSLCTWVVFVETNSQRL